MSAIIPWLPHLIALCNLTTLLLLISGFLFVRHGNTEKHKIFMLAAVGVSILFLIFYLTYHIAVGNVAFAGEGSIRWVYFIILITHVILAIAMLPMLPLTLLKAWKGQRQQHRSIARKTLPIWIYVSISGIVVYLMAFHVFPSGG